MVVVFEAAAEEDSGVAVVADSAALQRVPRHLPSVDRHLVLHLDPHLVHQYPHPIVHRFRRAVALRRVHRSPRPVVRQFRVSVLRLDRDSCRETPQRVPPFPEQEIAPERFQALGLVPRLDLEWE